MEGIKRFLLDESATAEASSEVLMIGAVAILLGAGIAAYTGALDAFFDSVQAWVDSANVPPTFPIEPGA